MLGQKVVGRQQLHLSSADGRQQSHYGLNEQKVGTIQQIPQGNPRD
jgi:hypothetical protein